jgi:hypothetical protein
VIGTSVETFDELYKFFADKASPENSENAANGASPIPGLPPLLDFSPVAINIVSSSYREQSGFNDFNLPVPQDPAAFTAISWALRLRPVPVGLCSPLKVLGYLRRRRIFRADGDD